MKLTAKELIKLKTKLALEGTGAKTNLANTLELKPSAFSLVLINGVCPNRVYTDLITYINKK